MAKIIFKLLKDNKSQIQDAQRTPNLINKKHVQIHIAKLMKMKDKENILKTAKAQRNIHKEDQR